MSEAQKQPVAEDMAADMALFRDLTLMLVFDGKASEAVKTYTDVFSGRLMGPVFYGPQDADKKSKLYVTHACVVVGNSVFMLMDDYEAIPAPMQANTASVYLNVPDVDSTYKKALDAGFKSLQEPSDQHWGDRTGHVEDPFGNRWMLATKLKEVSCEDFQAATAKYQASLPLLFD